MGVSVKKVRTCGNCVNCDKVNEGKPDEFWACEEYGFYFLGAPANVTPPNDEACRFWTDDLKRRNTWEKYV